MRHWVCGGDRTEKCPKRQFCKFRKYSTTRRKFSEPSEPHIQVQQTRIRIKIFLYLYECYKLFLKYILPKKIIAK